MARKSSVDKKNRSRVKAKDRHLYQSMQRTYKPVKDTDTLTLNI